MKPIATINIPARTLNAIVSIQANIDIRYYLNGVHIACKNQQILIEATDGKKLIRWTGDNSSPDFDIIVKLPKLSVKGTAAINIAETSDRKFHAELLHNGTVRTVEQIDGLYPDVSRVLVSPDDCNAEPASFNPQLVAAIYKAFAEIAKGDGIKDLGHAPIRLHQNGDHVALFTSCAMSNVIALVMPVLERGARRARHG